MAHNLSAAGGADYTKLMHEGGGAMGRRFPKPAPALQRAVVEATHAAGRVAVAHAMARADTLEVLRLGVDGLAHTFLDAPPDDEVVAAYRAAGAWVNPTLAALGSFTTEGRALAERFAHDPRVEGKLTPQAVANLCGCMAFAKEGTTVQNAYDTIRRLHEEGVPVIV